VTAFLLPQIVRWAVLPRMSGAVYALAWERQALDCWAGIGPWRGKWCP
jgi:hypothetical protein